MKHLSIKSIAGVMLAALCTCGMTTSCVGDLDVENINPQQVSELQPDSLFNKIYSSFVLTGQKGPAGLQDVKGVDEGRSQFYRMVWNLNELTSDEAHWVWYTNDAGYEDLVENNYSANNAVSSGLYYRIYFTISLCNFYLDNVADDGSAETKARRAEVRFIRAYNYFTVMDLYGNAAFKEHVTNEPGEYYTRQQFYDYVESELKAIEPDLKDAGQNTYGRVDKVADWLLLSRLYLNAEVYTGTPQWKNAQDYAKMVIDNGYYHLLKTGATNPKTGEKYSAYQMLFLADNDKNGAQYEDIFPIINDAVNIKSYGGMHSLILQSYSAEMSDNIPSGTNNSWGKCARVMGKLSDIFFGSKNSDGLKTVAAATELAGDDRALIYSDGTTTRYITNEDDRTAGYGCVKFRNVRSDGEATSTTDQFVDTDLPLMRIAEAYLNYAEASTRLNGPNADAASMINELRERAGAADIDADTYSLNDIRDEWAKEFWFEGRRRMDLVRFNSFGGQSDYKWEWMGNASEGTRFSADKNIFGIPTNDIQNNPNLKQNIGY